MLLQSLVSDGSSQDALKYAMRFELTTRHDCHHWLESLTWMICALTCAWLDLHVVWDVTGSCNTRGLFKTAL